jgi:hypothetical protein
MYKIKTFAATAILLASASQAYAATIDVTGTLTSIVGTASAVLTMVPASPSISGTFDTVTGDFDFDVADYTLQVSVAGGYFAGDIALTSINTIGTSGTPNTFATISGASCTDTSAGGGGNLVCLGLSAGPGPLATTEYTFTWAGGAGQILAVNASGDAQAGDQLFTYDFTEAPSAVPLPAAAWLFGSALLGLVGIGRRKRLQTS